MNLSHMVLTGLVVISPVFVRGESLLHDFARVYPKPSLGTIIDFLHEHRHEADLCDSITFQLNIERTEQTSPAEWETVVNIGSHMITACEGIEKNSDDSWTQAFGSPIQEWYQIAKAGNRGIHGEINLTAGSPEKQQVNLKEVANIGINIKMCHDKDYDEKSWTEILADSLNIIKQMQQCEKNDYSQIIRGLGIPLQTILKIDHVKKDLCITLKDTNHEKLSLGFKN